ncbi:ROK family transcriptional regulator [Microbacterium kribbense]|uniref:ROK family transcriptional regulator n=1 Tax=Microbacterium kribbense TaxID=433645 RepID=UPI0031D28C8B
MATQRRTPGSQASLREANRARIVAAIKKHGGLTQVELAGVTGLSPASVSNIVRELVAAGVLRTTPSTRSGRRATLVSFARTVGLVAGIHVSTRHLRVIVADVNGTVVTDRHMPLARDHRADNELDRASLLLADMLGGLESGIDELLGVGLAIQAPLDRRTGRVAARGILRGWTGVDIAGVMARRLRRPVFVDNGSNLGALAESRLGAARGKQNVIYIDLGDGIGSGLLLGGEVLRGHNGTAGELGHTIIMEGGPLCRCGNRGCLEAIAGGPAILERLEPGGTMKLSDIVVRAMANDSASMRALSEAGTHIGLAAGNLCNLLDPERIVVGGELARAGELLLGPIRMAMENTILVDRADAPDLVQGQLGLTAAAMGAVVLAIDQTNVRAAV